MTYTTRATLTVANPYKSAMLFSAVLGADKGVQSEVKKLNANHYVVIADDGQAVEFRR